MVYIGDSKMVGSQSAGHRLNAIGAGVGYYPFKPYSPRGNPLVAQDQFRHRPTLYGYGRVVAPVATVP